MIPKSRQDAENALKACVAAGPDHFDLTACSLACALHENPDRDVGFAVDLLADITAITRDKQPRSLADFAAILFGHFGFVGSHADFDEPDNADLIEILRNRSGLPVGLGIVWRHAARAVQAPLFGMDTPGYFLMRYEAEDGPHYVDPFEGGARVFDDGLSQIARNAGLPALDARMLRAVSDRLIAVRLQTNLVVRARTMGDPAAWFRAAQRRAILAPDNRDVMLDFAQAAEANGQLQLALVWAAKAADTLQDVSGRSNPDVVRISRKLN